MKSLPERAAAYMQLRHPRAPVVHHKRTLQKITGESFEFWPLIVQDLFTGLKIRVLAIPTSFPEDAIDHVLLNIDGCFSEIDQGLAVTMGNALRPNEPSISTSDVPFSPRLVFYSEKTGNREREIGAYCHGRGLFAEFVAEDQLYETLFISYGGPDEAIAERINEFLSSHGVKTWFFPKDAVPGEKLHRTMSDGVNSHSRVLLLCSKASLNRPGVLNEIERVLEREAREGGTTILIPIALDSYVYQDWAPSRKDLASQIRDRVISKIEAGDSEEVDEVALRKLLSALTRKN